MDNIMDKTTEEMYSYILDNPINAKDMAKYVTKVFGKLTIDNEDDVISFRKYYVVFKKWFPFVIKYNHYYMDEIVDILSIIADNEIFKCHFIFYYSADSSYGQGLQSLVCDVVDSIQFTHDELVELVSILRNKMHGNSDSMTDSMIFTIVSSMVGQDLDGEFVYDNFIKLITNPITRKRLIARMLPVLSDQEDFINKHIINNNDKIDSLYIFKETMLSDNFIINYFERSKESYKLYGDEITYTIATYRKFSPRLIKYFTDNNCSTLLRYYDLSFISKSAECKKSIMEKCNGFECCEDYFYGYKAVDQDNYSYFTFRFKYEPGKTYETAACGEGDYGSGFYVSAMDAAETAGIHYAEEAPYRPYKIIKVKVYYDDIAWINCDKNIARCSKLTVCE